MMAGAASSSAVSRKAEPSTAPAPVAPASVSAHAAEFSLLPLAFGALRCRLTIRWSRARVQAT